MIRCFLFRCQLILMITASAGYYIYARLLRHNNVITWAIWRLGEPYGGVFLCYLIKKNKRLSSYRRSQVNEWVLSLRTNFHIKLWIVSGGLSIYEYIITHWITYVFWVKRRTVCKSLFVYFGKYYEHVIDNSVYNMQLFMSQISVETLLIIKCT